MEMHKLNLSRKWRSHNFDQIIGQDLVVRMLKNSLYISYYFPLYLFVGQRGSGKTSTARIFAAAVNCSQLSFFQKNPKEVLLPCLECESCKAMKEGKHPDFIEIDAASHTGVDNIRNIIESASFMPVFGQKKIYLIDEAHMLSKAAFNALLKILEEPPLFVIFILATTDSQKILETVKSRAFQLFFKPISSDVLQKHLVYMCDIEKISYEQEGLALIVQESEGSVRDAQNILEQVRFSAPAVTQKSVQAVLGHLDDFCVVQIIHKILCCSPRDSMEYCESIGIEQYAPDYIWRRVRDCLRAIVGLKLSVIKQCFIFSSEMKEYVEHISLEKAIDALDSMYKKEMFFLKSTSQHAVLELLFLEMSKHNESFLGVSRNQQAVADQKKSSSFEEDGEHFSDSAIQKHSVTVEKKIKNDVVILWESFLLRVQECCEPLVYSLLKPAEVRLSEDKNVLTVSLLQDKVFFEELLQNTRSLWLPLLREVFTVSLDCIVLFDRTKDSSDTLLKTEGMKAYDNTIVSQEYSSLKKKTEYRTVTTTNQFKEMKKNKTEVIDVSDPVRWQRAQLVLKYFPGVITQVEG